MTAELRTPDPETITVTDYDFVFDYGVKLELTLQPADTLVFTDGNIHVDIFKTGEHYQFAPEKVLYTWKRRRAVAATASQPASVPPAATPVHRAAIDNLQVLPAAHTGPRE